MKNHRRLLKLFLMMMIRSTAAPASSSQPWLSGKKQQPKEVGAQQSKTVIDDVSNVAPPRPNAVSVDLLPVISPEQKTKIAEVLKRREFVKLLGENYKPVIDPKDLKRQVENSLPDFAVSFGIGTGMDVFDGWSYEQLELLGKGILSSGGLKGLMKFVFDMRNYALKCKVGNPAALTGTARNRQAM